MRGNVECFEEIARSKGRFVKGLTGAQTLDADLQVVALGAGVHTKYRRVVTGITEMSITAKLQFATLLFGGDALQQMGDLVIGEQRSIQHADFAMQPHPWWLVWFQEQFLGILLDDKEEQILQMVHASHGRYCRAAQAGMQREHEAMHGNAKNCLVKRFARG